MISHRHDRDRRIQAVRRHITAPQQLRLLDCLAKRSGMSTGALAYTASLGNISDTACKLNLILEHHGLAIIAERPKSPLKDRWGNDSQQYIWRLVVLR